ncbi:septum site-determining protein MinC [Bacillus carboniphilus]|uniref:Probable septum site-determining protein MinC n=1 Tax=Bacillus carboniphilus TaxID=86663 RepID=A0ABP3G448_9BACI
MKTKQNVIIKGTKDGLTLHLDDSCSFSQLLEELEIKLSGHYEGQEDKPLVQVHIQTGLRYLSEDQKEVLSDLVRQKKNLVVGSIHSQVITREEAQKLKEENEIVSVTRVIRSGQVLKVPGDLLLIGDVNPGGTVIAGGNIFVMGVLRGIAHAGFEGNKEAVVVASKMTPSQLRIADSFNRAPDQYDENGHDMECAYIDQEGQIVIDRLQSLIHLRPQLTRILEGGR